MTGDATALAGGGGTRLRLPEAVGLTLVPYEVQTEVFEGPFDLLLHLILREEVELYDVSLSTIVDEYLAHLERMQSCDLDVATEFLLIAATLVELKTRRLLPGEGDGDLDEELALWEQRDVLLARLLECKTFKDAALALHRLSIEAARSFPRCAGPEEHFLGLAPDLLEGVDIVDLARAMARAMTPRPVPTVDLGHVTDVRLTVAEACEELADELWRIGHITFRELTSSCLERLEVIVHFLALLELYKQGLVELDQTDRFGDIQVFWIGGIGSTASELATVDTYEG